MAGTSFFIARREGNCVYFYLHLFFLARPPVPILTFGVTLSSEVTDLIYYVPESLKMFFKISSAYDRVSLSVPKQNFNP